MTTILIVDDSLTVRMDLAEAIEAAGMHALPCASLAEARALLAREQISLVLLDLHLPDGEGTDLLEELRAIPTVMLSTKAEVADRIAGLARGASDYIGKPYDTAYVIGRIRQLVEPEHEARPRVLVIDDSLTYRNALCDALERAGYATTCAESGDEGLRAAAVHRPIAVIVDGVLPGDDGATVIRRIRLDPALRATPCILLTGSDGDSAELRALDAGADAFVRKEQDLDIVLARLAAVIRAAAERSDVVLATKRILAVGVGDLAGLAGYEVIAARTAEAALELVAVQAVDCIIVARAIGLELCRRVKAAPGLRDTPIVMHAPAASREEILDAFAAGADDVLADEAGSELLAARLQAQVRRKMFEDEQRSVREEILRAHTLAAANRELEAFSMSVSHDLRAPLRTIHRFTEAAIEDLGSPEAAKHLARVLAATERMTELTDALLDLSRIGRAAITRASCDLSAIASSIAEELVRRDPARHVVFEIAPHLAVDADARLMRVVLDNLLGNAWKFTAKRASARISMTAEQHTGERVYAVRDDGAGFDMARADRLFAPFTRLHPDDEFAGSGIGLATVRRIVERHGGRVWAEGIVNGGASVFFTVG